MVMIKGVIHAVISASRSEVLKESKDGRFLYFPDS